MKYLPQFILRRAHLAYLHDLVMTALALPVALSLRLGVEALPDYTVVFTYGVPCLLLIATIVYFYCGMYRGIWRYASMRDLGVITQAVTAIVMIFSILVFLHQPAVVVPRSLPFILWLVLMLFLGAPRLLYRMAKDRGVLQSLHNVPQVPILLLGANNYADHFIRALHANAHAPYRVVGIIDLLGKRVGRDLRGVPILGMLDSLEKIITNLHKDSVFPQRLVVADSVIAADGAKMQVLLTRAAHNGLSLSRLPRPTELAGMEPSAIKPVAVEDLLGRPQAVLDLSAMRDLIAGRTVLVTGAGGTIGAELARQIAALSPRLLLLLDNGEYNLYQISRDLRLQQPTLQFQSLLADIRDRTRIETIFAAYKPDIVFHAAALKHVAIVEQNPVEGILTNIMGAQHVADAALTAGTRAFVFISTDKAIKPSSMMGATKRLAELYCQALDVAAQHMSKTAASGSAGGTRFITVRFGNVLGSSGSVVPLFQQQLAAGGPLTITHPDMKRYFMTVKESVELVLQASAYGLQHPEGRGAIFVLDMGAPVKIVDLAEQMIRLAGLERDRDIKIEFTGIQPGEKLFEEFLDADENPRKIAADRIYQATPVTLPLAEISAQLAALYAAAQSNPAPDLGNVIRAILPQA